MQLKELDGWLVATFQRALKLRATLLLEKGFDRRDQFPFNVHGDNFLERCARNHIHGRQLLKIPSFLRVYQAVKLGLVSSGIVATMNPGTRRYPSDSRST